MNRLVLAASAALATVAMAPAANATVVDPINLSGKTTDALSGVVPAGLFSDVFAFTLATDSTLTSSAITSILTILGGAGDLDFSSVTFDGSIPFSITNNMGGYTDLASISGVFLAAGAHTLTVSGIAHGAASYGGNINITPVPEPAAWSLMIAGIAAGGLTMRLRARKARTAFA